MSRKNKITMGQWRAEDEAMRELMTSASAVELEKVEPGFKTAAEWEMIASDVTLHHTRTRLNLLFDQGKVERKLFRIKSGMVIRRVAHYRIIEAKKSPH